MGTTNAEKKERGRKVWKNTNPEQRITKQNLKEITAVNGQVYGQTVFTSSFRDTFQKLN